MATIETLFTDLPNLRNGNAANYTVVHIAAGIPAEYHFILSPDIPTALTLERHLLADSAMYSVQMTAAGLVADVARKRAVVLAAVRMGIRKSWNIVDGDLIAAQRHDEAYYLARHVLGQALAPAGQQTPANAAAFPLAAVRDEVAALTAMPELFEPVTLARLFRLGMAMPVVTGVILVKTDGQHHFIDQHKNVYRAVQRQVLGRGTPIPFDLEAEVFEDLVAHKSTHPINSASMITFAREEATKTRLMAAGIASAAVRVPAQYGPESAMSAITSLVRKAVSIGRAANIAVDMVAVEALIELVFNGIDLNTPDGRRVGADRAQAFATTHGVDLARCMGILQATCDNANIQRPALMRSYALARIVEENPSSMAEGVDQMTVFYRSQRERARRGILGGMALFGSEVPNDSNPLPTDDTMGQILAAVLGNNAQPAPAQGQNQQGN